MVELRPQRLDSSAAAIEGKQGSQQQECKQRTDRAALHQRGQPRECQKQRKRAVKSLDAEILRRLATGTVYQSVSPARLVQHSPACVMRIAALSARNSFRCRLSRMSAKTPPIKVKRNGSAHTHGALTTCVV